MIKRILMLVLLAAPLSLAAQKFAHFNMADVVQALPAYKTAQTELEDMAKKFETDLSEMRKEITTKMEKYQNEVNETTPANIRQRREQEIMDMQQKFEQARQDNAQAFEEARQGKMQPIYQKISDAVNAIAKEGNYVYVIDKSGAQPTIFINETISEDVTKKIMSKLGITAAATTK